MKQKTMVAIFAHPDDEAFGPAGTIALYAKTHDVYLICVTKGEAGQNHIESKRRKLSDIRFAEVQASAKILGVKKVFFLGFEDGMLSNNLYHKIAEKIQEKLEALKPETILTFEPHGVSGHIDHIAIAMVTRFVFYKLFFIKTLLHYCLTKERARLLGKDYFIYFPPGYDKKEIDKVVDITDVWDLKVEAMQKHQSQIHDVKRILGIQQKFPKVEYFLVMKK